MNKRIIVRLFICIIICGALIGAYLRGRNDVWLTEFKECEANMLTITRWETNHPPELNEYVKARYYHLANKIPKSWLGNPHDYGAVSTNIQHLAVFKGPSSGQAEYLEFLQKNNPPKLAQ